MRFYNRPNSHDIINKILIAATALFLAFAGVFSFAQAGFIPTLSLMYYGNSNSIQITVNAYPNSAVQFYYASNYNTNQYYGGNLVSTLGYTDNYGNFYMTVNSNYDNIPAGSLVYVVVNGSSSAQTPWPSYYNNNYNNNYNNGYGYVPTPVYYQTPVTLSQTSLSLSTGQSSSVSIYGNGNYYVSNNSNSSVASASVNGSTLNVYAYSGGNANITVCQYSGSCATLFVNVINNYVVPTVLPWYSPPPTIVTYTPAPIWTTQYYQPRTIATRPFTHPFYPRAFPYAIR
jgi:hypothetical protein